MTPPPSGSSAVQDAVQTAIDWVKPFPKEHYTQLLASEIKRLRKVVEDKDRLIRSMEMTIERLNDEKKIYMP